MIVATRTLKDIAKDIHHELELADTLAHNATTHAIRVGELFVEAKERLEHGDWYGWLEQHAKLSPKTASNYMRLHANRESIADLPVAEALKLLARPRITHDEPSTKQVGREMKELGAGATVDSTAHEETADPALIRLEDDFARVVGLLAEARPMNEQSAFDKRDEALALAQNTTRALKAYQEAA